jgi:hypothetical protein
MGAWKRGADWSNGWNKWIMCQAGVVPAHAAQDSQAAPSARPPACLPVPPPTWGAFSSASATPCAIRPRTRMWGLQQRGHGQRGHGQTGRGQHRETLMPWYNSP